MICKFYPVYLLILQMSIHNLTMAYMLASVTSCTIPTWISPGYCGSLFQSPDLRDATKYQVIASSTLYSSSDARTSKWFKPMQRIVRDAIIVLVPFPPHVPPQVVIFRLSVLSFLQPILVTSISSCRIRIHHGHRRQWPNHCRGDMVFMLVQRCFPWSPHIREAEQTPQLVVG